MKITINDVLPFLRCPKTNATLNLKGDALVTDEGVRYPIKDGIIDLVSDDSGEQNQAVETGYNTLKSLKYHFFILNPPWIVFLWGIGCLMTPLYMFKFLELPVGWVLDVPCGSGIFSAPIYKSNPCTKFVAIDYSIEMLKSAQTRTKKKGINNVIFIRADVAKLPFSDSSFSGALSFAGFHAFPDPAAAGLEIGRVLEENSPLLVTAACKGVRRISDYMIDRYLIPNGYFSHGLPAYQYQGFLDNGGIKKLQVNMAGAMMVAKGYKAETVNDTFRLTEEINES